MYELSDMLRYIENIGGVNGVLRLVADRASYFRKIATANGLKVSDTYMLSNVLTPIEFTSMDADVIASLLRERYGIYVNPGSGNLGKRILRVAHIGNNSFENFDYLLTKILEIVTG